MDSLDIINTVLLAAIVALVALAVRRLYRAPGELASLPELLSRLEELFHRLQPVLDDVQRALARPRDIADDYQGTEQGAQRAALKSTDSEPPAFAATEPPQSYLQTGTSAWPRVNESGIMIDQIWQQSSSDYSILDYLEHILCALKTMAYMDSALNNNVVKTSALADSQRGEAPTVATH
jgi:hypothetical protein